MYVKLKLVTTIMTAAFRLETSSSISVVGLIFVCAFGLLNDVDFSHELSLAKPVMRGLRYY